MSQTPEPYIHRLASTGQSVLLCQIWFDEASRLALDPLCLPVENRRLGPLFEAEILARLLARGLHRRADLFGLFSWRFSRKIPLRLAEVLERLSGAPSAAVYSFFGAVGAGRVWRRAERKHPGILAAANRLLERLDVQATAERLHGPLVYQHHFIARTEVFERFTVELLNPALLALTDESDAALQNLLRTDSGYHDRRHSPEWLRSTYGTPFLPLHPFVAERLFSTWLALNPEIEVHHLWDGRFVEARDLRHEPELGRLDR